MSGTYQVSSGPMITATWAAPNSVIAPALGRNLAAGATATKSIQLIEPGTQYAGYQNQLDHAAVEADDASDGTAHALDANLYNVFNNAYANSINTTFSTTASQSVHAADGGARRAVCSRSAGRSSSDAPETLGKVDDMARFALLVAGLITLAVPAAMTGQEQGGRSYPQTLIPPGKGPFTFPPGYQTPWDKIEIMVTEKMSPNLFVLHGSRRPRSRAPRRVRRQGAWRSSDRTAS